MTETDNTKDFIQQAVNNAYEQSIMRMFKKIEHKRTLENKKRNIKIKKRKIERQNRRKARK